ncbi:MAG: hypothetical protein J7M08_05070 [Planctomycetes bacterium]|nr:hypothetical protein [Planctomycetota bacterium]
MKGKLLSRVVVMAAVGLMALGAVAFAQGPPARAQAGPGHQAWRMGERRGAVRGMHFGGPRMARRFARTARPQARREQGRGPQAGQRGLALGQLLRSEDVELRVKQCDGGAMIVVTSEDPQVAQRIRARLKALVDALRKSPRRKAGPGKLRREGRREWGQARGPKQGERAGQRRGPQSAQGAGARSRPQMAPGAGRRPQPAGQWRRHRAPLQGAGQRQGLQQGRAQAGGPFQESERRADAMMRQMAQMREEMQRSNEAVRRQVEQLRRRLDQLQEARDDDDEDDD